MKGLISSHSKPKPVVHKKLIGHSPGKFGLYFPVGHQHSTPLHVEAANTDAPGKEAADAEALVDKAGGRYGCNYGFLRYMLHGHDVSLWMATATFCAPVFLFVFILLLVLGSRAFTQYLAAQICRRAILWLDTTSEERVQPETSWSNTVVFCFHKGVTLFLDVSNLCMFTCGHDASH